MCICVNCRHINCCTTYLFIKNQHLKRKTWYLNNKFNSININFIPSKTILEVNVKKQSNSTTIDWDLVECLSFVEKPGAWIL